MEKIQIAYIPIGVPTFHLDSAQVEFEASIKLLSTISKQCIFPEKMLLSIQELKEFCESINPDLIILQNITFANAAYCSEVLKYFRCPILLWTLREPVIDGTRLRLNSLTGAYSAANTIRLFNKKDLFYVYGGPEEQSVIDYISSVIRVVTVKKKLSKLVMLAVGHTPEGFGFGRAMDIELMSTFGVTLKSIEIRELMEIAKNYSEEEIEPYLKRAQAVMFGLEEIPEKNRIDFARLLKAYETYIMEQGVEAVASRCWPDVFTYYKTPVCAVLAMLNDQLIAASCEADTYGALSMYIGSQLTGRPTFFGDPVSINEEENTITYWHCGTAACSLASQSCKARVSVHCNRKIGPTLEFGCKACKDVTIFRVGKNADGIFRMFVAQGEALEKPKQFFGTSVVVRTKNPVHELVSSSVKAGWEPHFIIIYGNVAEEIELLAELFQVEVVKY